MTRKNEMLVEEALTLLLEWNDDDLLHLKPSPDKWSKKEILGHLIDSAINNLQRFTELEFTVKPYKVRPYNQDQLVKVNDYQHANVEYLIQLWHLLNKQILRVTSNLTPEILAYPVVLPNSKTVSFQYLIEDYFEHMEHHLTQIRS